MHAYDLPALFAVVGLVFYTVLAGADFGAGFWQLTAGRGPHGKEIREHAEHAMGPVWEANHVWLIFVLTVFWTGYPAAFGAIASTLSIPLFVAGIGIVLRGGAYVLRDGDPSPGQRDAIDTVFSVSSILTPLALGAAVGGIASGRVPQGNAAGDIVTSWLNPTSLLVGVLAVAASAYTAAAFLCGDARRSGNELLAERFRRRALGAGVVAGAVAAVGLVVVRSDAHRIFDRLLEGPGLTAVIASAAAGVATLSLAWGRRYEPARYTAAVAVAGTVVGWGLAQQPVLLPGLTVRDAAAPYDTQVALVVAVLAGAVILFPALAFLFRLTLAGHLKPGVDRPAHSARGAALRPGRLRLAGGLLVVGIGLLTAADSPAAHAFGATCLLLFVAAGYRAVLPHDVG
jgi:cytochrome d ubiquinol oxidase subunit II